MILLYDGTFDGLLTALFEAFEYKISSPKIIPVQQYTTESIFEETHTVITNEAKAQRVLKKVEQELGKEDCGTILRVFLSEQLEVEELLLYVVQQCVAHPGKPILKNYGDDKILHIAKIRKSIGREVHRMHAFIRFERLEDDVYFATIEPDFNVLPLIFPHFKARYADQKWMIYDVRRQYGVFYDLHEISFFTPEAEQMVQLENARNFHHDEEKQYQRMWQNYFVKTGIASRKNMKLHLQHVPKRYWKYLTEKM